MRQALGVTLSNFARRQLERIRQSSRDRRVWMRASTLLMSARGVSVKAISATIGVGRDTVTRCCRRWRRYGLTGLQDRPRSGRPPVADAAYTRLLLKTVRQSPLKFGYVFTVWSVGRLSAHLEKATKNQIGPERLRQSSKRTTASRGPKNPRHSLVADLLSRPQSDRAPLGPRKANRLCQSTIPEPRRFQRPRDSGHAATPLQAVQRARRRPERPDGLQRRNAAEFSGFHLAGPPW